jgi:hypothetical protein
MAAGFDTNNVLTISQIKGIKAAGYSWVGRYYSVPGSYKNLTRVEAQALTDEGIPIVAVFERDPVNVGWFTQEHAKEDANFGYVHGQVIGQPTPGHICYSVDYDASKSDLEPIAEYFTTIHGQLKPNNFLIGAYGSGMVIDHLLELGVIDFSWLSQSTGFAGYGLLPNPDIRQLPTKTITIGGTEIEVDEDELLGTIKGVGAFLVGKKTDNALCS